MSSLTPLGLTETGELAVPPVDAPLTAGYYAGAKPDVDGDEILPGTRGSAVVAAHVDGVINGRRGQPGLFFRLHELVPGDEVQIERDDGVTLQFVVTEVRSYPKNALDHAAVYERNDKPRLNLVTCAGPFQTDVRSYRDNLVVFTELVG
jgi:sortase (surface protein transpeptidase)